MLKPMNEKTNEISMIMSNLYTQNKYESLISLTNP